MTLINIPAFSGLNILANKRMEMHKKEVALLQQLQGEIDKIKEKGKQ